MWIGGWSRNRYHISSSSSSGSQNTKKEEGAKTNKVAALQRPLGRESEGKQDNSTKKQEELTNRNLESP